MFCTKPSSKLTFGCFNIALRFLTNTFKIIYHNRHRSKFVQFSKIDFNEIVIHLMVISIIIMQCKIIEINNFIDNVLKKHINKNNNYLTLHTIHESFNILDRSSSFDRIKKVILFNCKHARKKNSSNATGIHYNRFETKNWRQKTTKSEIKLLACLY